MFRFLSAFLLTVVLSFLGGPALYAQVYNSTTGQDKSIVGDQKIKSDSNKGFAEKGMDYSVTIYSMNKKNERAEYDTAINQVHRLGLLSKWELSLGNAGSAYQSLKATAFLASEYSLLPAQWKAYSYHEDELLYYNTTKPFSEVRYSAGSQQEQVLELFHTQNISPTWNFSTAYRKINSLGFFKGQKSNIDNFKFVSGYQSKNNRYKASGSFLYNKIQQDENLGILSDSFLTNPQFSNRSIVPVGVFISSTATRSPLLNYRRSLGVNFHQEYGLGKTESYFTEDSVKKNRFKPFLTFGNKVYYQSERYCFQNSEPDSVFQANYFPLSYELGDTLLLQYDNNRIGTSFSAEGNVYIKDRVFSLMAGLGLEYQKVGGLSGSRDAVNNFLFGQLSNKKSRDSSFVLLADLKLYYTGLARGNLSFNGLLSKTLPKNIGTIGVKASQYVQQAFYVAESIQIDSARSEQTLKSQINTSIGGFYKNEKLKLGLSLSSLLFNNLIFSDGLQPNYQNFSRAISVQQFELDKGFAFKKWKIDNALLVQITSSNTPLNVPLLASFHRFAYHDYLFKNKLQVSTGFDISYNTPYFNDQFQPVFQSFTPQQAIKKSVIPRLHPFFNFKIKRFRASVSVDQFQHFFIKNNINYLGYPAQGALFRFGLRWIFIN
jgi:hypothetical protein